MNNSFNSTTHRTNHSTSSSPSPKSIPTNGNKARPASAKPAPLRGGCASCGKKR